jgi:hypothetical protein
MSEAPNAVPDARLVDPERLTALLTSAGWRLVGGRRGVYNRFAPPDSESRIRGSLLVPLDRRAPEFEDLMASVLLELSSSLYSDAWERLIFPRLRTEPTDQFRFRKESGAPAGLISWRQGEELVASARATLLAGAKSYVEPARQYSNRFGQFAGRYLDTIFMGQTALGSYIVTAFVPATDRVPLRTSRTEAIGLFDVDVAPTRRITEAVAMSVEATIEAIAHYRESGSLSAFEVGVERGVSFEMTAALRDMVSSSDGADISIEWDPAGPVPTVSSHAALSPGDAPILDTAAHKLAVTQAARQVTVTGRVHLLTKKEAGGPGVIGIENVLKETPRKVRVHLSSPDDYHAAVQAHDRELLVQVSGDLEREGNLHWLYRARLLAVLEPSPPSNREAQSPDQLKLDN